MVDYDLICPLPHQHRSEGLETEDSTQREDLTVISSGERCKRQSSHLVLFSIYMPPLPSWSMVLDWVVLSMLITLSFMLFGGCPDSVPDILDRALWSVAEWLQQSWLKLNPTKMETVYLN